VTWETVVGLEVHVQLLTRSKMFCGCSAAYGDPPNTNVCPVCLGLPGALPVPNAQAVRLAVRAALALGCRVRERSVFARKNYFYPDLPKGYQISQYEDPLATGGALEVLSPDRGPIAVGVTRLHLEEDAAKSFHDRFPGLTAVDFNRSGVPLIEIVSEPDLRSPAEARAYLVALKQALRWLGVSDCNMEEGSLRVDANVSVRRPGAPLGTRTEVKNMNSFSGVERALVLERHRQIAVLESGGTIEQRTMTFDAVGGEVRPMRSKEESHDYRYFPDPDLPPLVLSAAWLDAERASLPELPAARRARFAAQYGLSPSEAAVVAVTAQVADHFERLAALLGDAGGAGGARAGKDAWNWEANDVLAHSPDGESIPAALAPERIADVVALVRENLVSRQAAKKVLAAMLDEAAPARALAERLGLVQVQDATQIADWVREVLAAHPAEVERFRNGEARLLAFFTGQVMKRSRGKADPKAVTAELERALAATP
jgi:aspartyl-tRNA(Asn)/glutamyl-tRNA(Gln) amidotransferase subunit B